jgi:hypothetical protein
MIEALGSIGELIAAIATVATLFYLATQIRQSTQTTRAAAQQQLLDTFYETSWSLGRDTDLARVVGAGLVDFDSLSDRDKTVFTLTLGRFVGNVEKGLRLRNSGFIDQDTFDGVATGMVAALRAPGGEQWWRDYRLVAQGLVVEYLERRVAEAEETDLPWHEQFPYWAGWGVEETAAKASVA